MLPDECAVYSRYDRVVQVLSYAPPMLIGSVLKVWQHFREEVVSEVVACHPNHYVRGT